MRWPDAWPALGARVVLVGRDPARLEVASRDELDAAHGPDRATAVVADMASLRSVRDAVEPDRHETNRGSMS